MGNFDKMVAAYRAKHGVKHAAAVRAIRAQLGYGRAASAPILAPPPIAAAAPPPSPLSGWHGFGGRVARVIALAEAEALESKEDGAAEGISALLVDMQFTAGSAYRALLAELETFDDQDTRKLEALMYSGRERVSLRTMHRQLRHDKPEHARSQIMSKRGKALPEYLLRALQRARDTGVDLDAPLPDAGLLDVLARAGVSDSSLDRWNPQFLSLRLSNFAIGADAEVVSRTARGNAARGGYILDLGHESIGLAREAGVQLEDYLTTEGIMFARRRLTLDHQRQRVDRNRQQQRFVVECLRWSATYHDQSVQQLWTLAQRAGVRASMADISASAEKLASAGTITQKAGASSDCFWVTEAQLRALGGAAEPAWAAIHIREVHPGPNRTPDHALPASPDTPCTLAPHGTDVRDPMTLDHLTPRADGKLYVFDNDDQPWPGAIVTLADCKIGDLVYLNCSNWVASPAYWTLYEVVSADTD